MYGLLISFYLISIPLGYLIGLRLGFGLKGVWYGMLVGLSLLAIYYLYLIMWHFDWEEIGRQSKERERVE